jgi:dihydrofolate reductase
MRRKRMRKLSVSTLVSLDGVIQDPGEFGETARGGWANPYFTAEAQRDALEHMLAAGYFLIGRVTYGLLRASWENVKGSAYLDRVNEIPKLVASASLTGPLPWNAMAVTGDVAAEIARLKTEPGGDIEVYGSATLVQTLMRHDLIDEYRVAVHPVVLGGGTPLFPPDGVSATLRLTGTRTLDSGVVSLIYAPADRS